MTKKILTMVAGAAIAFSAHAVMADPTPYITHQPDGTIVSLRLCGDEHYSFTTTIDGYTVMQLEQGQWVYVQRNAKGILEPTTVLAHNASDRTPAERALLAATQPGLVDLTGVERSHVTRAAAQQPKARKIDIENFRGLIILIEPSDVSFSMGDNAAQFYETVINGHDMTNVGFGNYGTWTGSVRDYFYDNTMGVFDPQFDVLGPVKVSKKATEFRNAQSGSAEGARAAFREALSKLNYQVDYNVYDGDGDGYVDAVCFVVAGYGSHYVGNNGGYLWPHESTGLGDGWYDDKRIDRYSCSTEMAGGSGSGYVDGIGTFCHEFTHVLGFPDLYDTDYAVSGQAHDPGNWDLMAGGSYLNRSRTPAGYSIFERYALGFANPRYITDVGEYTLEPVSQSNDGLILRTPQNKEYFIMENRQKSTKWDAYLPGHGLLVTRVDSTTAYLWTTNKVNCNPAHMYYELLRAGNTTSGDLASDPFPGSNGVPVLNNNTTPSLLTWAGKPNTYSIFDIHELNGVISFEVEVAGEETEAYESFNHIPISEATTLEADGDISRWKLMQCQMVRIDNRNRAVAMKNPSVLQMLDQQYYNVKMVSFYANNTSGEVAKFALQYSTDGGNTWTSAKTYTGATTFSVPGLSERVVYWNVKLDNTQGATYRIQMTGGSKTTPCQVDDFSISYVGDPGGHIRGDVDGNGKVEVDDMNVILNILLKISTFEEYPYADVDGNGKIEIDDMNIVINIMLHRE